MKNMITRRNFLAGAAAASLGVYCDMKFIEPKWLKVVETDITLPQRDLSSPIRILQLSDLHVSERIPVSFIDKAIQLGLSQKPDLICLTGDLISRKLRDRANYLKALKALSDHAPCYACVGNHDGGDWVGPLGGHRDLKEMFQLLGDANIEVLFNDSKEVSIAGNSLELVGLGDYWANDTKPKRAFANLSETRTPRIVLSHNPDSKNLLEEYQWDVMLCGHTHGGQLSLPIIGTPFAPVRDHGYVHGLNKWKNRLIYTTSGIGNLHGMRLNCRPELSILNIEADSSTSTLS